MTAKRATLLTVAMLFTIVIAAVSINSSGAENSDAVIDGYGVSSLR